MYDFQERLAFSDGIDMEKGLIERIMDGIPGSSRFVRATMDEDRSGVDYWVERKNLPAIGIDVKHRAFDPLERFGSDDACIETTSVYKGPTITPWCDKYRLKPGWTLNETKRTDLVVYTWPTTGKQRRFWILYFPHLCRAAQLHWREWTKIYGERAAINNGYLTLNVFPPRRVIAAAMRDLVTGETVVKQKIIMPYLTPQIE